MSKKVLTVEFSKDFLGFEVSLLGLLNCGDLELLCEDVRSAMECFYRDDSFSILLNAFGFEAFDEAATVLLASLFEELEQDVRVEKLAFLYHRNGAPCEVPETVSLFVEKSRAVEWLKF